MNQSTETPASNPGVRSRTRNLLRENRLFIFAELIVVLLITLIANVLGVVSFNETPVLFLFGWLSLWLRDMGWGTVGLKRPARWSNVLLLGVGVGSVCQLFTLLLPLLVALTGKPLNLGRFASLKGNVFLLMLMLARVWTLTVFGEELTYRGYLMNRVAELMGGGGVAWAASLVVVSVLFGIGHLYQGVSGVVAASLGGLVYGLLYLWTGRNLWSPIIAHGVFDTTAVVLIFWDKYPGHA